MAHNLSEIIDYLSQFVTEQRFNLFLDKINKRTRWCTIALENIYQSQNASAVLRTCECFGIQDVHIIENQYKFSINPDIALGSSQWLNLKKYSQSSADNTLSAIKKLKHEGYRIIATTPHENGVNLHNFDIDKGKFALFFGSELPGLSEKMLNNADEFIHIPMVGFTESLNISVSAAICLHHIRLKLEQSKINWQLSELEKQEILFEWLKISIKSSELILKKYYQNKS